MSGTTGSSTGSSDVSLNDLSANHNNELFANAVADSCVDALAQMDLFPPPEQALEDGTLQDDDSSSKPKPKEDKQFLLADNTGYVDVMGETENLWNKAITTLSKNKAETPKMLPNSSTYEDLDTNGVAGKTLGKGEFAKKKAAYDMSPIMLDGDITGGEAPGMSDNDNRRVGR
ncbi:expressed unknown protein [Seminavis robusta]|uniref:Uncharacterized protein n=1 Tax=Seminavis robusta TaxID=568900 RepID=A0A9N8HHT3_9STRA|nr:expressed unknown protein [Seminavis robusta]|eukprot:Sro656_g182520.1 n/a (173) ;mRNA; f:52174-52692